MFNKKKQPPIKSLIAEGSQIVGNISFTDGLRVDGSIVGNILAGEDVASILVISEIASISGEILPRSPSQPEPGSRVSVTVIRRLANRFRNSSNSARKMMSRSVLTEKIR